MNEIPPGMSKAGPGELKLRVVSALVLAAGILAATVWGGWPFRVVWAGVAGLVTYEWFSIVSRRSAVPAGLGVALVGLALGLLPVGQATLAGSAALAALVGAVLTPLVGDRRALETCGIAYAMAFAIVAPALRAMPDVGIVLIFWSFAVVWFTDIAAYFTGRRFGGPKLMPRFSPKKTWSGAIGGAVAGTACGYAVWALSPAAQSLVGPVAVIAASLFASIASQAGDLFESAIKRRFGAKDSSQLIPGHGGFLDRLDGYWSVLVFAGLALFLARLEF